jgi:hypothetical protein
MEHNMRILVCSGFVVSVMALVAPAGALAQAVTSFDGTYAGASLSASGATAACSVKSPVPAPLIISGGNARTQQGEAAYQGSVNAQGVLQLHTPAGTLMYGKIDASGAATAGVTVGGHNCTYSFAWKKK